MPTDNFLLRKLLALNSGTSLYTDDGELQGQSHGISFDFLNDDVETLDRKFRQLNTLRLSALPEEPSLVDLSREVELNPLKVMQLLKAAGFGDFSLNATVPTDACDFVRRYIKVDLPPTTSDFIDLAIQAGTGSGA